MNFKLYQRPFVFHVFFSETVCFKLNFLLRKKLFKTNDLPEKFHENLNRISIFFILSFISFFLISCATLSSKNINSKFSGQFSCPEYKGDDNQWEAEKITREHQIVNGVDILVTHYLQGVNTHKHGPYNKRITIVDGMWRYYPLYRNNTLYPVKVKYEFKGEKLHWYAEYPDIIDNKGKKRKAHKGEGSAWFDSNGDEIATASHFKGQIKCKRAALKPPFTDNN